MCYVFNTPANWDNSNTELQTERVKAGAGGGVPGSSCPGWPSGMYKGRGFNA